MKCYGLSETLAPYMESGNLKFACDKCVASNNLSMKSNFAALTDNCAELTDEIKSMKAGMSAMKTTVHNVATSLPP